MSFTVTALALFGILFFWGAGVALLVLPRRWRGHWPVFAPMAGIAAMSATVWVGIHTPAAGAATYGRWTWAVPVLLLGAALWRARRRAGLAEAARRAGRGLWRHAAVIGTAVAILLVCAALMDRAAPKLTSFSAGSCDVADYAAGARVMRDFAGADRTGQIGNREVVALHSADNFVDHWLRQNHFTPAALLALFSSVLGMKIHELATLLGAVLLAAAVPMVWWAGRALFGLRRWMALLPAAAFGVSGTQLYAVAQVALAQLIAAGALVLMTWGVIRAWREGRDWRGAARWVPVLALGAWLFLGAYNFMLLFAPSAAGAWLLFSLARTRDWGRFVRVTTVGFAAVAAAALFAPARVLGLAERFALFGEYDFGWFIPAFSPERWIGWFGDAGLGARPGAAAWVIGAAGVGLWLGWAGWALRRAPARLALAAACLGPALAGYWILEAEGYASGSHATYNAYKIFAVFHPLVLVAFSAWLGPWRNRRAQGVAAALGLALVAVHWSGGAAVRAAIARPVLTVDGTIWDLRRVEAMPDIASLNLVLEPFWARLWANGLLLRKPQYFAQYTYETRRPTALRGDWDLRDRSLTVRAGGEGDYRTINQGFYLVRRASVAFVDLGFADGWYAPEHDGEGSWCWSRGSAALRLTNPQAGPRTVTLRCQARSIGPRDLVVRSGAGLPLWSGRIEDQLGTIEILNAIVPPGETLWEIQTPQPAVTPAGDSRPLALALYNLEFESRESPPR